MNVASIKLHHAQGAERAMAQLAEGAALERRIAKDRPGLVVQALLGGATPEQVTGLLGWDVADLSLAVGRWATRLRQEGRLTEAECATLLDLAVRSRAAGESSGRRGDDQRPRGAAPAGLQAERPQTAPARQ